MNTAFPWWAWCRALQVSLRWLLESDFSEPPGEAVNGDVAIVMDQPATQETKDG